MAESRHFRLLAAAALGALIAVAYANSFQAELTVDSKLLIGLDPRIKSWSAENLRMIGSESYWGAFARSDLYRPLTTLSYLANYSLLGNGARPLGYHWVNLLFHAANAGLALVLLRNLGAQRAVAWLAAALFAVHPVNVEAVTNIVGRADLLATLAVLGSGLCYIRAASTNAATKAGWLILAGIFACAGAFAKENAMMAVGFAVLYDAFWRWPALRGASVANRFRLGAREFGLKGWVAFLPALTLLVLVRSWLGAALTPAGYAFVDNPILYAGPVQGLLTAIGVIGRYLCLFLLPVQLSSDYSYNEIPLYGAGMFWWQDWIPWLSLIAILGIVRVVVRLREKQRLVTWGLAFFFLMLLPVSNLLLRIGSIMAERFLYLPSLGLCTAAAVGLCAVSDRLLAQCSAIGYSLRRVVAYALPALILAALVLRTWARNGDWRDERSIWQSAVASAPNSFKSHLGYSATLLDGNNEAALDQAIARAEVARQILDRAPLPVERLPQTAFSQLGTYYRFKGELVMARKAPEEARAFFMRAVAMLSKARDLDRRENELLRERLLRRNPAAAEVVLAGNAKIYVELAISFMHLQDWRGVEAAAHKIQRYAPSHPSGYALAALAEASTGRDAEAAMHFFAALVLNSSDDDVRANLSATYDRLGVRPSPVGAPNSAGLIDTARPRVRRDVDDAFVLLVRNHWAAGLRREAEQLRDVAERQFQVPRERLVSNASP